MKPVMIIGMGLSPDDLTERHKRIIHGADILMGGERHLAFFDGVPIQKMTITGDLEGALAFIRENMVKKKIVILASGDPLFFGIGAYVAKALGPERVEIMPNISSVAAAFARIKEPWENAKIISLHGRDHENELVAALNNAKDKDDRIAVFTDRARNPAWLAAHLLKMGFEHLSMCVFERLGTHDERIGWYPLKDAAALLFLEPNVIILKPEVPGNMDESGSFPKDLIIGMAEEDYAHEESLITKSEVRAITLSKLRLLPRHTLWDLGAGSGSVGIEASLLVPLGRVFSVERRAQRVAQIKENAARFHVGHLKVIHGVLPEGMDDLPDPDRVFVGGGGKGLEAIIQKAATRLKPHGIIVINVVLMDSIKKALNILKHEGFHTDLVQVQISRARQMPWSERLEAQNPVWIIRGERKD